ncbi:MAG: cyclic nucleotide-binding domain-containing protein [Elusimicrobia bacterium]|nr:cyclic nucleotide-binding domain-containing protein [Elusimicrobiota bacterium]
MDDTTKLKALRALRLLERIPDDKLPTLAGFLKPSSYADGTVIFEEGTEGDALLFIAQGHIRISKRVLGEKGEVEYKDLAIVPPGECVGEMSLMDPGPRSARATARGEVSVFQLERGDLLRWLDSNPQLAVGFFAEVVHTLTRRLRRSSNELALLFDLSQWLLEPIASGKDLLQKVLGHLVPHIEGSWRGAAFLYNEFNEEFESVAAMGDSPAPSKIPAFADQKTLWLDGKTIAVALNGPKRLEGYLVLTAAAEPFPEIKNEIARTLATAAGLISSALENIRFRTEDQLRARLKASQSYGAY